MRKVHLMLRDSGRTCAILCPKYPRTGISLPHTWHRELARFARQERCKAQNSALVYARARVSFPTGCQDISRAHSFASAPSQHRLPACPNNVWPMAPTISAQSLTSGPRLMHFPCSLLNQKNEFTSMKEDLRAISCGVDVYLFTAADEGKSM